MDLERFLHTCYTSIRTSLVCWSSQEIYDHNERRRERRREDTIYTNVFGYVGFVFIWFVRVRSLSFSVIFTAWALVVFVFVWNITSDEGRWSQERAIMLLLVAWCFITTCWQSAIVFRYILITQSIVPIQPEFVHTKRRVYFNFLCKSLILRQSKV